MVHRGRPACSWRLSSNFLATTSWPCPCWAQHSPCSLRLRAQSALIYCNSLLSMSTLSSTQRTPGSKK
ncbi:hypothetical protein Q5P01_024086 [Channa striata]|uniref:Uncharacterized protein n=1 Tax=Channa striata TaxID=64152 RepID=A0AA88J3R2_CHASR|nr:hypothetical protein Q5P01_024086 [Channa striata]